MSIISQALKKAQDSKPLNNNTDTSTQTTAQLVKIPDSKPKTLIKKLFIYTAISILFSSATIMAFYYFITPKAPQLKQQVPHMTQEITEPKFAESDDLSFKDLKLNGIMSNGKELVAVINGNVMRSGDKIAGVTVKKINPNSILLEKNTTQKTITLSE